MLLGIIRFTAACLTLAAVIPISRSQSWKILASGSDTNFRGLGAVKIQTSGRIVIWASGSRGVIVRSIDDGSTWSRVAAPGASDADFRGIVAISEKIAYVISSGEGEKSAIFKTVDAGKTWARQYAQNDKAFFLDSIACLSESRCFALGDPIQGKFVILQTADGVHWAPLANEKLPVALPKEGAFAASNSNLLLRTENEVYLITGGFAARVLHTIDGGKTWAAKSLPIASDNASSGVFSIARSSANHLVAVGGDYAAPAMGLRTAAIRSDPDASWQSPAHSPSGYRSAVVSIDAQTFLACGPTGSDISQDSGAHWQPLARSPALNVLFAQDPQHIYGAGPNGTIAQFDFAPGRTLGFRDLGLPKPVTARNVRR